MSQEQLSDKQFFLLINGPSCSGKSTTTDIILERYKGIFHAKSDTIKWLISGYVSKKYRGVVHEMTLTTARIALENGLSVIKEGGLYKTTEILDFCKEHDIKVFFANLEPPEGVLWQRFEERKHAAKNGARIANTSDKRFKELIEMYHELKMDTPLVFDSSTTPPEEIAENIVEHIKNK